MHGKLIASEIPEHHVEVLSCDSGAAGLLYLPLSHNLDSETTNEYNEIVVI